MCFLDFSELFAYNFASPGLHPDEPRPPLDTEEAMRLILMRIQVTGIEEPSELDGKALPVVHFVGYSKLLDSSWDPHANSSIRGMSRIPQW